MFKVTTKVLRNKLNTAKRSFELSKIQTLFKHFAGHHEEGQGGANPREPNNYGGAEWMQGTSKSPNNVTSTFFNTIYLLLKDLRF